MKYGFTLRRTSFLLGTTTVTVRGYDTVEEAKNKAIELMGGYTNPKWWEFWRYRDNKLSKKEV